MSAAPTPRGATPRPGDREPLRPVAGSDALADDELAAEIELYADVVLAASESDGPLQPPDLDRLLGVEGSDAER
ncbi:hypothetical protein CLV92_11734 [Kineococcus xinjiangensis]|uniref:Uncharacterized protein n=1 Tax=Kineococcus xinjiangensis TaxID=512762 RepID=A0A2S6ICZ1_9ACTN|nr:hypothetical protein [Kineococcus xinjiangensis]PPK92071.1 hypothetical protein CLV92_11734 [Kineococcus xinjiangensis]